MRPAWLHALALLERPSAAALVPSRLWCIAHPPAHPVAGLAGHLPHLLPAPQLDGVVLLGGVEGREEVGVVGQEAAPELARGAGQLKLLNSGGKGSWLERLKERALERAGMGGRVIWTSNCWPSGDRLADRRKGLRPPEATAKHHSTPSAAQHAAHQHGAQVSLEGRRRLHSTLERSIDGLHGSQRRNLVVQPL